AGLSSYFAYQSAKGAKDAAEKAWEAHKAGDDETAMQLAAQGATNAAFAGLAAHHAARSGIALNRDIANAIETHNEGAAASVLADAAQHWGEEPPPEDFAQPQPATG